MSLDAIGIVSKDIQKSIAFYSHLGLSFQAFGGDDHYEAQTPSGIRVMLDSETLMKSLNPNWRTPSGNGIVLCFKQTSPDAVDKLTARIKESGFSVQKEPWDAFWGQRYATVKDPDGNSVDIFADLKN